MVKLCKYCNKILSKSIYEICKECSLSMRSQNSFHNYCIDCKKELAIKKTKRCRKCYNKTLTGVGNPRAGIKLSESLKNKIRQSVLKNPRKSKYNIRYLILHNPSSISCSNAYRKTREKVLKRDKYTCQICGNKKNLVIHHIKDKKYHWKLFFILNNLITLCRICHAYLHKYKSSKPKFKSNIFKKLLKEIT